jgi:hypothetical protein
MESNKNRTSNGMSGGSWGMLLAGGGSRAISKTILAKAYLGGLGEMASEEIALAPCPTCSKLISVEALVCPHCGLRITEAKKREMLQSARVQVTNNRTINDLWIKETRKHEVSQAARVQETPNLWEWLTGNASKLRDFALAGAAGAYALGLLSGLFMP